MDNFWPAVLLGAPLVLAGSLILIFRRQAQRAVHARYLKAQERRPNIRFPGKSLVVLLGASILLFGIVAIALGLVIPIRTG
ncbi:hypothetical protein [Paenarthrobacter sp. YJN-D]|uniref:hypothetical protein n=1 Tax=Paenarthrobacter sp. YJN-D TaxID=2735317 RepID=UPI000D8DEF0E|nr:hypothetical protein [Paenarthrobacter sp. YJN-D]QOT21550.1 hypothetical protein HMI60_08435 [Paenarthrobacter sp. YJN-D]